MLEIESVSLSLGCICQFVIILQYEVNWLQLMLWTAPGVLYMKTAGLYACCDVLLHQWLTYLPSPKLATDSASGVDRVEVTVDVGIAQATLPITSPTSRGSFCCTTMPVSYTGCKKPCLPLVSHYVSEKFLAFHRVMQQHFLGVVGFLLMTLLQMLSLKVK